MTSRNSDAATDTAIGTEVFDRAHLARYTLNDEALEREIIGLFLTQLPSTIALIEMATSQADWKLATHTLKGAAAAIGAPRLEAVARDLEALTLAAPAAERLACLASLAEAARQFRTHISTFFPAAAA